MARPRPSPIDERLAFALRPQPARQDDRSFFWRTGRRPAAGRHSRHGRGFALDRRRRRADRARRRPRPRCRRHRRRHAACLGRERGPRRHQPAPGAGAGSIGSMAAGGATAEVGPADLTVWEFDLLGERRGARPRLRRSPASAAGITPASRVSISRAGPPRSCIVLVADCRARPPIPTGGASPSSKAGPATAASSPARSGFSIWRRGASRAWPTTSSPMSPRIQWRDAESLWFAGWHRLGSVYGVIGLDGAIRWMDRRRMRSSAPAASSPRSRPRPTARASPPFARPSGKRPRSCCKRVGDKDWRPLTKLNSTADAGLRCLSRGARDLLARRRRARHGGLRPAAAGSQAAGPCP